jgi:hypothetical protein
MMLSAAIPIAIIFTTSVWAQLNVAQCAAGFDWVRGMYMTFFKWGVIT